MYPNSNLVNKTKHATVRGQCVRKIKVVSRAFFEEYYFSVPGNTIFNSRGKNVVIFSLEFFPGNKMSTFPPWN